MIFGWGRGGYGFGNGGGSGSETLGYELGRVATTNDVASGFNNSAVLGSLNDIKLGLNTGFSNVQQTLCQGFGGVNTALVQQGYETRLGLNGISTQLADCCCNLRAGQAEIKYAMSKDTCDIINAINAGNQRLIDIYTNDKIDSLRTENATLKGKISNSMQTSEIISALAPKAPIPAYPVFPTTSFAYPSGVTFGINNTGGCGCNSVQ